MGPGRLRSLAAPCGSGSPPEADEAKVDEAGETGSEAERRLRRMKRSGGSERNEQRERQRGGATIELPGLRTAVSNATIEPDGGKEPGEGGQRNGFRNPAAAGGGNKPGGGSGRNRVMQAAAQQSDN